MSDVRDVIKRYYIAGRMANEPGYVQKFLAAQDEVRLLGHEPIDPCTIHDGCCQSWSEFMHHDLRTMLDCDGIYALRDWRGSKGATIEIQLALRLGKEVIYQEHV